MKREAFQDDLKKNFKIFKNNIALQCGDRNLTYGEVDRLSDITAGYLIEKGIESETFIGILMDDRIEFILTLIGILKARCVFVPLDPGFPDARLKDMITTTGISILITDTSNLKRFEGKPGLKKPSPEFISIQWLFSNSESPGVVKKIDIHYSPQDKIYIYFTSGSTGRPKALLGKNSSLLHFIRWEIETFNINESFRFSQFIVPTFDAILRDLFVPLCSGGTLCIPYSKDLAANPAQLVNWVEKNRIHVIHCVPFLLGILSTPPLTGENFKELKFILISGEKIEPRNLVRWYDIFAERIQLVNLWGPTETTMVKTSYLIRRSDVNRERIPVGKPMKGSRVIVLDRNMKRCPPRVTGQLYIRTPYRTFGYYNDPKANKERFIQNPFSSEPDDLLYATGDLGRLLPDGNIDVLGRQDRQFKIRGIRIEPGEIESVLVAYPSVKEAVVIKREITPGNEILCACICADGKGNPQEMDLIPRLRQYLSDKLPDYMVPATVMEVEEIPRSTNGKVDYKTISHMIAQLNRPITPPADEIEKKLFEFWTELLKVENIGTDDRFFELGGNSLNTMNLIAKIHREFDTRISLEQIFRNPTIRQQGEIIKNTKLEKYSHIPSAEKKNFYTLSSTQKRLYFTQQKNPGSTVFNMPYTMILEGIFEKERVKIVFRQLTKRHESFRTSFEMVEGEPVQRVYDEVDFEMEYFDTCTPGAQGTLYVEKIIKDFVRPFDLSRIPLMRAGLIAIEEKKHILMVDMHHIISDGTSMGIFAREFMSFYQEETSQPALNIQFKDYLEWQGREEQQKWLKQQEDYWLEEFKEGVPVLNLPYDYKRPTTRSFEGNDIDFRLDKESTAKLKALALEEGLTLFQLLLAVFNVLLAKISGREDIVVGTVLMNRGYVELQDVICSSAESLVMRNRPQGHKIFRDFLIEVKNKALEVYEHQHYPYADLVEKLSLQIDPGRNPIFDVQFQFENMDIPDIKISQVKLARYDIKSRYSKLDILLSGKDTGENVWISLQYDVKLFKEETIRKWIEYFRGIVATILINPDIKLSGIEITPKERKKDVIKEFSDDLEDE